jgi:hypothetical protein
MVDHYDSVNSGVQQRLDFTGGHSPSMNQGDPKQLGVSTSGYARSRMRRKAAEAKRACVASDSIVSGTDLEAA